MNFNPRPPRGGRRRLVNASLGQLLFQSTPPARGATGDVWCKYHWDREISIHAPREGGDDRCRRGLSPAGTISIHAPREGGDRFRRHVLQTVCDFNPRPPRGGRLQTAQLITQPALFQSTPPARGATPVKIHITTCLSISIHAPREGGDVVCRIADHSSGRFQSTPPARGATLTERMSRQEIIIFQSTPPARGATAHESQRHTQHSISIHAPREGGDFIA